MSDDPHNAFITRVEPGPAGEGPLAGRTLAVKDLFDTAGVRTTYGSGLYAEHVPERNATAVRRLVDAGAVVVGKTHLPEFAWGVLGQSEWYGTCHNPTHPGKTTGGSSSGSAAALAAGGCGFEDVVKVTVYLTDIDDRPLINPVRQTAFGATRPASTLVEVPRLAVEGAKVEIECVALVP